MPVGQLHVEQAQHNLEFLQSFYSKHKNNDWAITVAFYSVLHIIENMIFVQKAFKFRAYTVTIEHAHQLPEAIATHSTQLSYELAKGSDHELRTILIRENFPEIKDWYRSLYNESRIARYDNYKITTFNMDLIVKPSLGAIIEWSNNKIKTDFKISL